MNLTTKILTITLLLALAAGCGATRLSGYLAVGPGHPPPPATQPAGSQPASQQASPADVLFQQAEDKWAKRDDGGALKDALVLYEKVIKADPSRRQALSRLARGYYLYAYGHAKTDEEILGSHDAGARWGERIMGLRPEFRAKMAAGEKDYENLNLAQKEDVPGIYWSYGNLGKWSVKKGFTTVLKNKSKLKAFISRVAELDPGYYHGAGDRGLAAFYAKAPSFAGGDLNKAKEHFEKSLKVAPNYFGTKVLMARYYATKKQDKALFKRLLEEVIAGDANALPDVIPMQKIEQRKAKELLGQIEDKFE